MKLGNSSARVVYGSTTGRVKYAGRLSEVLYRMGQRHCLVHIDVDRLDTSIGLANEYAAPGGLDESDLLHCLNVIFAKRIPVALTVASLNPDLGGGDRIADVTMNAVVHFMARMEENLLLS